VLYSDNTSEMVQGGIVTAEVTQWSSVATIAGVLEWYL